ncbi:MAG TPA: FtsQ-type POTRA domain-containing protein [Propionibacteriaceae bacterium]|jgi:cell division protein FtsQ|nr:FtsQ-type POTRA domain-containing protein [Propionibacteriaceae bacterium]
MTAQATVRRRTSNRPTGKKTHPRNNRKGRKSRRSGRRKVLAFTSIALVLALLGVTVWGVYFSTALVTKRVSVIGTHGLTPMQVSFAAQVPLGVPLARQDMDAIAERTTSLPPVESAAVTRDWPSTIRITVVERKPVLAVRQPDGYAVVDKSGVAYQTKPVMPPEVLLAEVDAGDAPLLSEVAIVANSLPKKLRGMVDRITAGNRDSIVLVLESGRTVTWGSSSDSELKAQVARSLLKRKPKSSLDVSSPHNPAVG